MPVTRGRVRALVLAACVYGLTACSGLPSAESADRAAGSVSDSPDPASLIAYAHWVHTLSPEALDHLYYRLLAEDSPTRPIRLALVLSNPETPFQDVELARRLLDDYLGRPPGDTRCCREFAAFMRGTLDARDSREHTQERLVRLREAHEALRREAAALRASAEEERGQRLRLERQIEALKAIEMNLNAMERRTQHAVP